MSADKKVHLREFNKFLRQQKTVDFRTIDLLTAASLKRLKLEKDSELHKQVKAYQRLLRLLLLRVLSADGDESPVANVAKGLLKLDIMSALQITTMGKKKFIKDTLEIFSNDHEMAEKVYQNALVARKLVTMKYVTQRQNLEPYKRVAKI
jgi:hypothetical protein